MEGGQDDVAKSSSTMMTWPSKAGLEMSNTLGMGNLNKIAADSAELQVLRIKPIGSMSAVAKKFKLLFKESQKEEGQCRFS